jgi:hypothetical protein
MPRIINETITVSEGNEEVATEIPVQPGQRLVIRPSGSIWAGVWFTGRNGPQGWSGASADWKFPREGFPPYCLMGRLQDEWFEIGRGYENIFQPGTGGAGQLTLRINDDAPGNGNGAFVCQVEVWQD